MRTFWTLFGLGSFVCLSFLGFGGCMYLDQHGHAEVVTAEHCQQHAAVEQHKRHDFPESP